MPNGFAVQPDKLAAYQAAVKQVADDYRTIVGQLDKARITDEEKNRLLGAPEYLGPSGPPVDFTNLSRTMLTNYDKLLGTLHRVHTAVATQFARVEQELGETHGLYLQVEAEQTAMFQNLLDNLPSEGS
jgi:hypothetical protein